MSGIARNSVNGRLNCSTFYSSAEVVPVRSKQCVSLSCKYNRYKDVLLVTYCSVHQFQNMRPGMGGGKRGGRGRGRSRYLQRSVVK